MIMSLENFPEEVLEKIINLVYYQSQLDTIEYDSINERRKERIVHTPQDCPPYAVYLDHKAPPILTPFQNLAALNQRFHRICSPKLWEKIRFPSDQPAPISHWTENLLLHYGGLVKSASFELDEHLLNGNDELFGTHFVESESTLCDNTVPCLISGTTWIKRDSRYRIGLVNIEKIFKTCPTLKSITVIFPLRDANVIGFMPAIQRLQALLITLPQLQHLRLEARCGLLVDFVTSYLKVLPSLVSLELSGWCFAIAETIECSFESILSHHPSLRKLSLENVTFDDGTWILNSRIKQLTTLEIRRCKDLSPRMLYNLISGSAPSLAKLCIQFDGSQSESDLELTEQFNLPSLKELNLPHHFKIDLLNHFETCQNLEALESCRQLGDRSFWNSIKHQFSLSTWPNLLTLRLHQLGWFTEEIQIIIKKEVKDIWKDFGIHVLVNEIPYREESD